MPEITAFEKKSVKALVNRSTDVEKMVSRWPRRIIRASSRRAVESQRKSIREALVASLKPIAAGVKEGRITVEAAELEAARLMTNASIEGAKVGVVAAGMIGFELLPDHLDEIAALVEEETAFFRKFMEGIANESIDSRVTLYGGVVDSALWRTWLSLLPKGSKIQWVLGLAEHCEDCLALAISGPYDMPGMGDNPIRTVPRNGDTRCKGNCRCSLVTSGSERLGINTRVGVEIIRYAGIPIPDVFPQPKAAASAQNALDPIAAAYAQLARLVEADGSGAGVREAAETLDLLQRNAQRLSVDIGLTHSPDEIVEPVRAAKAQGFAFVAPGTATSKLDGRDAVVITTDAYYRGRIESIDRSKVTIGVGGSTAKFAIGVGSFAILLVADEEQSKE